MIHSQNILDLLANKLQTKQQNVERTIETKSVQQYYSNYLNTSFRNTAFEDKNNRN